MNHNSLPFGLYSLDRGRGELRRGIELLPLSQRGIALLQALLEADGEAVSKAELMEKAWPGLIVEEGNLTVQIAALRKALGTTEDGNDWIVTVPRVGYRLLQQQSRAPAAIEHPVLPSLAVLPFQNLSGDVEQDYFADGVVEDIITALSRFKSFAVIARNSTFVYKGRAVDVREVAADLGVRYVLEGSVRRGGNRLRITAQLVEGVTNAHLWAHTFDGEVGELFDFQDRITESVVSVVEPNIQQAEIERSRRDRPESLKAYDLYLKSLALRTVNANREATAAISDLLAKALAIEPQNPTYLALASWALCVPSICGWGPMSSDARQRCIDYIDRALLSARDDSTVLSFCANSLTQGLHDYERGIELAHYAIDANPNNLNAVSVAGVTALHFGDVQEAINYFHRGIRLNPRDPNAPWPLCGIAHAELVRGNYTEALRWAGKSFALDPQFSITYWMLIAACAHLGRMDEARVWLAKFRVLAPNVTVASIREGQPVTNPSRIAAVLEGLRLAGLPEE